MSGGHGEKLSRKHEAAVAALLTCSTIEEAASMVGVGQSTLRRWMKTEGFRAAFARARREAFGAAMGRLQAVAGAAVEALNRNLGCGNASAEVSAARVILEQSTRMLELADLLKRIEALETVPVHSSLPPMEASHDH